MKSITTLTKTTDAAVRFFLRHAGYSYDPKRETKAQGRTRCATTLALAEEWAKEALSFQWSVDRETDSSDFSDDEPAYTLWVCAAIGADEKCVASLHGIDFGRDGQPWGSTYKRVVEAELASEAEGRT